MTAYLDNSATTCPYDGVIARMGEVMRDIYANPSSMHTMGMEAEKVLEDARKTVARSIDAEPSCIVFTSGGTESDNLAVFGACEAKRRAGKHIVTSMGEHPAVMNAVKRMERDFGCEVDYIPIDSQGRPKIDVLEHKLRRDTVLVSMMLVNNELGSVYPITEIKELIRAKAPGALFHCDAVQGYAKTPCSVKKLGCDLMTVSSHKIHGPKGVGALYIADGARIAPLLFGGGQERGLRSGTENVQSIAGFAEAVRISFTDAEGRIARIAALRDRVKREALARVGGLVINSPEEGCAPHILNISLPGLRSEVMLHHLESRGVFVSAGSACSAKRGGSHVLANAGFDRARADSALRISFGDLNTEEDCDALVEGLVSCRESLMGVI